MSTTVIKNVIAVKDSEDAGCISWWRLSGDINKQALEDAWTQLGLPEDLLCIRSTPATALAAALFGVSEKRLLKRSTDKSGEFAMVRETAAGGALTYAEECRAFLDDNDELKVSGTNPVLCEKIKAAYDYQMSVHGAYEVSQWLAGRVLPELDALSLRDKGGIYFVPKHRLELWRLIVKALRQVSSHAVFEVAAMRTEEAVHAILDAVEREAAAVAQAMETELIEEDLSVRVLRNRVAKLDEMAAKVSTYEALLGSNLDKLRERLEALNAQMAAAILTASVKADEQEAA
jgi:hypothetical protein